MEIAAQLKSQHPDTHKLIFVSWQFLESFRNLFKMNWQHIEKIQNLPRKVHILGELCQLKYTVSLLPFLIELPSHLTWHTQNLKKLEKLEKLTLNIQIPQAWLDLEKNTLLLNFERAFATWREAKMREFTMARTGFWLEKMQTKVSEWQFKKLKATWGLCRLPARIICLNTKLYHFSPLCIEAVLVHELSHLFYPNHSPKFYQHLLYYFPEYKKAKLLLREPLVMIG